MATRDCHVLVSNSNTDFIRQLWGQYGCFDIHEVEAPRQLTAMATGGVRLK
ncbi:hypothetical protein [Candidatus Magnetobacterium casense]|uniref:hypothetical protein n=1 Tax=Candidatus Magnetobacterium casense TaxID=1455061 RepID=UPI001F285826